MTNDEINSLTDEQINVMVTRCEHDAHGYELSVSGSNLYKQIDSASCGISVITVRDHCNDVNAMWPLILSNSISILFGKDESAHLACQSFWNGYEFDMSNEVYHSNPLRAAAIVYLKIKGVL